jgi:RNA polymerase sigma factor (sigma-70 family)
MTDSQSLLREYAKTGSDAAFRELVDRYINLVYSTALRRVDGDTHRAQDICQIVFLDLARTASKLSSAVMVGGWLHRHTCFVALNIIRQEHRRETREQQAVEMNNLNDTSGYSALASILDDAINHLEEPDRTAILLRFFEQLDFRAVGKAIGTNEQAARMRVNRALEKLQCALKQRGITSTGAAIAVLLSANAVQAAPLGVAATISLAAAAITTAAKTTAAISVTKTIAMTTIQKAAVGAAFLALVGVTVFQAEQNSNLRDEVKTLRVVTPQVEQLQRDHDDTSNQLAVLRAENADLKRGSNELRRLRAELRELRQKTNELAKTTGQNRGIEQPIDETEMARQKDELVAGKEIIIKSWLKAFYNYAKEHNGDCPPNFQDATQYLSDTAKEIADTSGNFELLYHGSLDAVKDSDVILFREKNLWQHYGGKWGRFYGIADGHPQYCSSSDKTRTGSFDQYESEHLVQLSGQ